MKFKLLSLSSILLTILLGCNSATQNKSIEDYVGIPFTAKLMAENPHYAVFTNVEAYDDDSVGIWPPLEQVSLWAYDKQKQKSEMMLLTHLDTDGSRYNTNESFTMPADTIPTIQRVTIISYPDENLKLLVEGSRDYRNVESFTVELGKKEAIYLPTIEVLLGLARKTISLSCKAINTIRAVEDTTELKRLIARANASVLWTRKWRNLPIIHQSKN